QAYSIQFFPAILRARKTLALMNIRRPGVANIFTTICQRRVNTPETRAKATSASARTNKTWSRLGVIQNELGDAFAPLRHALLAGKAIDLDHRKSLRGFDQVDAVQLQSEDFAAAAHQVGELVIVSDRRPQFFLFGGRRKNPFDRMDVLADGVGFVII